MSDLFKATTDELRLITAILDRLDGVLGDLGETFNRTYCEMDLRACNANGCPMDFAAMLDGDNFSLLHDIAGISRHIDRTNGKLKDNFLPRFAKPEEVAP